MNITSSISGASSLSAGATLSARRAAAEAMKTHGFGSILRSQQEAQSDPSPVEGESEQVRRMRGKVRDVSETYIAQSLVQPLLKQAREMRDDTPPFGATQAEKQFGALMDERTALDMVKRGHWGIVENVEKRLLRAAGIATDKPTQRTSATTGETP